MKPAADEAQLDTLLNTLFFFLSFKFLRKFYYYFELVPISFFFSTLGEGDYIKMSFPFTLSATRFAILRAMFAV